MQYADILIETVTDATGDAKLRVRVGETFLRTRISREGLEKLAFQAVEAARTLEWNAADLFQVQYWPTHKAHIIRRANLYGNHLMICGFELQDSDAFEVSPMKYERGQNPMPENVCQHCERLFWANLIEEYQKSKEKTDE